MLSMEFDCSNRTSEDKHLYISIVNCCETIELFSCFVCDILPHILRNLLVTLTSIVTLSHEIVYDTNIASDLKNASQYQKGDTSFMVDS
jgi:hypothetical protein